MALTHPRVIESVQVRSLKRGRATPSSSRPARLTVIPGKIEIQSTEAKFPTIHIKPFDLVKPPKRVMGKIASWISLDFIQNFDAKFLYVNVQAESSKMDELLETLLYAWSGYKSSPSNILNLCYADEIYRPAHKSSLNTSMNKQPMSTKESLDNGEYGARTDESSAVPAKLMRLESPSVKKSENSDQSKGEVGPSNGSSLSSPPPIPWLNQLRAAWKENVQQEAATTAATTTTIPTIDVPSVETKSSQTEGIDTVKEYREIEREFNLMAAEVYRMKKKDRVDLVNSVKTMVNEAVNKKTGEKKDE